MLLHIHMHSVILLNNHSLDHSPGILPRFRSYSFGWPAHPEFRYEDHQPPRRQTLEVPEYLLLPTLAAYVLAFNTQRPAPLSKKQCAWYTAWAFHQLNQHQDALASSHLIFHSNPCIYCPNGQTEPLSLSDAATHWFENYCLVFTQPRHLNAIQISSRLIEQLSEAISSELAISDAIVSAYAAHALPQVVQTLQKPEWTLDDAEKVLAGFNALEGEEDDRIAAVLHSLPDPPKWLFGKFNGLPALLIFAKPEQHPLIRSCVEQQTKWRDLKAKVMVAGRKSVCRLQL